MIVPIVHPWEGLHVIRRPIRDAGRDGVSIPAYKRNYEWFAVRQDETNVVSSAMTLPGLAELLKYYGWDRITVYH